MWSLLLAVSTSLASPPSIDLSVSLDDSVIAATVWEHAPDLADARSRIGADAAEAMRARILPNPQFEVGVGTLPVGQTNPPNDIGYWDVPNYNFGVSELLEIGKRGPRQRATAASYSATVLETRELLRQRVLDLSERLPDDVQSVFLAIAHAAVTGEPCPADAMLAQIYGTHSVSRARRLLTYFEEQNLVVVRTDFHGRRIVAFPDLGVETAPGDPASLSAAS